MLFVHSAYCVIDHSTIWKFQSEILDKRIFRFVKGLAWFALRSKSHQLVWNPGVGANTEHRTIAKQADLLQKPSLVNALGVSQIEEERFGIGLGDIAGANLRE